MDRLGDGRGRGGSEGREAPAPAVAVDPCRGQPADGGVGAGVRRACRGEHHAQIGGVERARDLGEPAQRHVRQPGVAAEHAGDGEPKSGVLAGRAGHRARHVHCGVEGVAEQQRHHDRTPVPVGCDGGQHVGQPREAQIEKAQPHVQVGPLPPYLVDESGDRGGRPGIPAAVRDRDQGRPVPAGIRDHR